MTMRPSQSRRKLPPRRGFSLVEAAFVTLIAGFVTVGTLQLVTAGTIANKESSELTTAINLAENIHEYTMTMDFDTVYGKNNISYSPPIDAGAHPCTDLGSSWKQTVGVSYVNQSDITTAVGTPTKTARVTVTVYRNNIAVHTLSWIVADPR